MSPVCGIFLDCKGNSVLDSSLFNSCVCLLNYEVICKATESHNPQFSNDGGGHRIDKIFTMWLKTEHTFPFVIFVANSINHHVIFQSMTYSSKVKEM